MTRVSVHGLVVDAAAPIAERAAASGRAVDLTVVAGAPRDVPMTAPAGDIVALVETTDGLAHAVVRRSGGYLVRVGGAAEIEIDSDLTRAVTHCDPAFDEKILDVLVAGFLLATVLQLAGRLVLHASAVEVGGSAYALVGPSGRGKSTLATLLCSAGALLVGDDVLRIDPAEPIDLADRAEPGAAAGSAGSAGQPGFVTRLGATATRLRPKAAQLAGAGSSATADGRTAAALELSTTDRLPLAGVLLPHPDREISRVELEPVTGAAAMVALLAAPRILGWREPASLARQLRQLGDVASAVPVHRVRVPWGPPFADDLGAQVLEALGVLAMA